MLRAGGVLFGTDALRSGEVRLCKGTVEFGRVTSCWGVVTYIVVQYG